MKLHSSCRYAAMAFGSALALAAWGNGVSPDMTTAGASADNAPEQTAGVPGAAVVKTSLKQLNRILGASFLDRALALTNTLTIHCAQGGTATLTLDAANGRQLSSGDSVQLSAANCVDGKDIANGAITIDFIDVNGKPSSASAWNATLAIGFTNFTFNDGDKSKTANGALKLAYNQTAARTATFNLTSDTLQLRRFEDNVSTDRTLSGLSASGSVNGDVFTYRTGFTLQGDVPRLANGPYTFATSTDFVQQEGNNPSQGVLQVRSSDGSTLVLTALDTTKVNLALDGNGDGVVDLNTTTTWDRLDEVF